SFRLPPGGIVGIIGANGAGKTTLFNIVSGFLKPMTGDIYYNGKSIKGKSPWKIALMGIGRLFQDIRIFPHLTVLENMMVSAVNQPGEHLAGFLSPGSVKREIEVREKAIYELTALGLNKLADRLGEQLSYGQQKRLGLGRIMMLGSSLLLLDEPFAGLDKSSSEALEKFLLSLPGRNKSVILIEHDPTRIQSIADHVFYLEDGHLKLSGSPGDVLDHPYVKKSYLEPSLWEITDN
ncbi:MAG: ABC transporter ATP-binding protein, partial [Candidatus Eremiobacteraeota bacterium]|nr:ABC transporter ATP-binding protein [Candidatus Eremiobacteraeota bacterium]